MYGSQRNTIIAAVVVLAIIATVVLAVSTSRRKGDGFSSSFQFWTRDPAYGSPPLMNPYAPRSQLFRDNTQKEDPLAGLSNPLQASSSSAAAFTASPADGMAAALSVDEDFRGPRRWRRWGHRHAAPLWFAGPMSRYAWGNTPYFWNGPTPSYYGSFPYYATW